jgi:hypothetical protein
MNSKVMSLRVSEEVAAELHALAWIEGVSVSETIRAAIHRYTATCRADQSFRERLRKRLDEERQALERLESWGEGGRKGN